MTIREVMRRLNVAEAAIRPANSMGARLKKLSATDRSAFDEWQAERDRWARQFHRPDALYAALINGNEGPQLPLSVRHSLYGDIPRILVADTDAEASDKYQRCLER